ncbi:MAG TPA: alpha/beta fold hydrolase [Candidatus Eisenbacteria bacterium]|nr:alpha/beta fold hydrolase [Candidatus Eisenbacteria bacterium]
MTPVRMAKRAAIGTLALAVGALTLWIVLAPIPAVPPSGSAAPARDHDEALARFHRGRAGTDSSINVDCLPRLLTHGYRAERAVVLLHGFTNCPRQFDSLAVLLYERGFNVYLPRVPRHGNSDRMTTELSELTAEEISASAESALDLARGLGDRVTIVGLSVAAVATAWLATRRPDLDEAVLVAPSLGPKGVSLFWTRRITSALLVLPNFFAWWDPNQKEQLPGPAQSYPRFSSRALAHAYRLGLDVMESARDEKPAARRVTVVSSASDEAVSSEAIHELVRRWRARGADIRTHEFPESLAVAHDMIDPEQPYEKVAVTYPEIVRLVAE